MHNGSQTSRQASYMLYHLNIDYEDIWQESDFSTTIENMSEREQKYPWLILRQQSGEQHFNQVHLIWSPFNMDGY